MVTGTADVQSKKFARGGPGPVFRKTFNGRKFHQTTCVLSGDVIDSAVGAGTHFGD